MDAGNPFAPPSAEVRDIVETGEAALGSPGIRLIAVIVDGLIQLALLWQLGRVLPWKMFASDTGPSMLVVNVMLGVVTFLLVQGVLLVRRGQTLGKMMLGLRIVRSDGSRAGPLRLLALRYGVGWGTSLIPSIGLLYTLIDSLLILRPSRRCLHDLIADTIVVKA